jgi:hypothetical protein
MYGSYGKKGGKKAPAKKKMTYSSGKKGKKR